MTRRLPASTYDDALFTTDGSDASLSALDHARDVADRYGAILHALDVANADRDSVTVVGDEVVQGDPATASIGAILGRRPTQRVWITTRRR